MKSMLKWGLLAAVLTAFVGTAMPAFAMCNPQGQFDLTTGKATIVLDGAPISLKADGDIKVKAGGEVVIHGGPFVKINCEELRHAACRTTR